MVGGATLLLLFIGVVMVTAPRISVELEGVARQILSALGRNFAPLTEVKEYFSRHTPQQLQISASTYVFLAQELEDLRAKYEGNYWFFPSLQAYDRSKW
jgi:hypothetical protein